jgi:AraC family transcriptional regulator of adaptative response / DNA-3-methyladenine glycosylase II
VGSSTTVARALRLIDAGALDDAGVEQLSARLGIGDRHLRRLFDRELGASPLAVAMTRRAHFAKKLLDETNLPMGQIALAAGFRNVRRFNAAMQKTFGRSPTEIRRRSGRLAGASVATEPGSFTLRLAYRPPYDWDTLVRYLAPRAMPGVESIVGGEYRRAVICGDTSGVISVSHSPQDYCLILRAPVAMSHSLLTLTACVRSLFDLDADPEVIADQLETDPVLAPLVRTRPGLRLPGAWDRFELAVRAILGQQVSVKGATTLAGRLVRAHGEPLAESVATPADESDQIKDAAGDNHPTHLFPSPTLLAVADLTTLGMPRARAKAIRKLAAAVRDGDLNLTATADLEQAVSKLTALPGIGAWTAQYIAMRALREPDAFPAADLGLLRAMSTKTEKMTPATLARRAEVWRPWRAYAAMHLWMSESVAEEKSS